MLKFIGSLVGESGPLGDMARSVVNHVKTFLLCIKCHNHGIWDLRLNRILPTDPLMRISGAGNSQDPDTSRDV